jgi:PHD/YefM family antitoxin component YafN of YafNO toxin-antitoxin module
MLHVDLDNILTNDELASRVDAVLQEADEQNAIFVVTRNGRPAVAILKLEELEKLSGREVSAQTPATTLPGSEHGTAATESAPAPMPEQQQSAPAPDQSGLPDMPDQA